MIAGYGREHERGFTARRPVPEEEEVGFVITGILPASRLNRAETL